MPYELFWHGPISAYLQFRAAHYIGEKEKREDQNRLAWLNGIYINRAVAALKGKSKYPNEPIKPQKPLTLDQKQKQQQMIDAVQEHNRQMREIREKAAIKLYQKLTGANSDGK